MTTTDTTITAPTTPAAPVAPVTREIDLDALEALVKREGASRIAQDSPLLADVQAAIDSGKARVIDVSADWKASRIMNHLRGIEQKLGVKLQKWDKSEKAADGTVGGYVAFKVRPADQAEPVTADGTVQTGEAVAAEAVANEPEMTVQDTADALKTPANKGSRK